MSLKKFGKRLGGKIQGGAKRLGSAAQEQAKRAGEFAKRGVNVAGTQYQNAARAIAAGSGPFGQMVGGLLSRADAASGEPSPIMEAAKRRRNAQRASGSGIISYETED